MTALKWASCNKSNSLMASFFCSCVDKFLLLGQLMLATVATQAARNSRFTSGRSTFTLSVTFGVVGAGVTAAGTGFVPMDIGAVSDFLTTVISRSEERRVGKECSSMWSS